LSQLLRVVIVAFQLFDFFN